MKINVYRYDNEYGYAHRVMDLILYMYQVDSGNIPVPAEEIEETED